MQKQLVNVQAQRGFALLSTLVVVTLVGILAVSSLRSTELTEVLSGNSIQRSRAFQAAEGALLAGESATQSAAELRVFSSVVANRGIFSRSSVDPKWWRDGTTLGIQTLATTSFPGVSTEPLYVVEELGNYQSDGGTGIISLDRGAGSYGQQSNSGREQILYRVQAKGAGSVPTSRVVVESLVIRNR